MHAIYKFIKLMIFLYRTHSDTKLELSKAQESANQLENEKAFLLQQAYRRIFWLAIIFWVVGTIVIPCATPWISSAMSGPKPYDKSYDAMGRMVLGLIFSVFISILHLFAGFGLGWLLAPAEFIESAAGKIFSEIIGTTNRVAAKVICLLVVLASFAAMIGMVRIIIGMGAFTK